MKNNSIRTYLAACSAVALALGFAGEAFAQAAEEIVVTGSRIRRSNLETAAPVAAIQGAELQQRGFTNVADAINELPVAGMPQAPRGDQGDSATGRNFLNLFNLGSQRTLVLVNGRRYISGNPPSPTGTPGNQVDLNTVPTGMIDRIEVVQAGGAAVYGTDAVAGVVNIIMKKKFEGVEVDFQYGISDQNDYPVRRERITAGQSFLNGRANIAVNAEHSWTGSLTAAEREFSLAGWSSVSNPKNTGPADGIPATIPIPDHRFIEFSAGGVPFRAPAPLPQFILTMPDPANPSNRVTAQFGPGGNLIPYNLGTYYQPAFSSGGDGYRLADVTSLVTPVKRDLLSSTGYLELTDNVRLTAELQYARTKATEPVNQGIFNTALLGAPNGPIRMTTANPYLTTQARDILNQQGATAFFLSRASLDLIPDGSSTSALTKTYRGVLALDGDFKALDRNFYWNTALSSAYGSGYFRNYGVNANRFNLAVDAVRAPSGQIVCASTLANPGSTNADIAQCQPLNLFGAGSPSEAAKQYVSALFERAYSNRQTDFSANLGGELFTLPAGKVNLVTGVEYRRESASYTPNAAAENGIGRDIPVAAVRGGYNTKELYSEVSIPVFGDQFKVPFAQSVELTGSARYVDHSIAGGDNAWSVGGKWKITEDVMLRGTRSNTFRAPSLTELFLPTSSGQVSGLDPCDQRNLSSGSAPAQRQANCAALFRSLGLPADYKLTSLAQNASITGINSGNPNLRNERAKSWSAGIALTPRWVPGLTVTADWVKFNVTKAIVAFDLATILSSCYDAPPGSAFCGNFTRDSQAQITGARTGFVNAAYIRYYGQNFVVDYQVPLDTIFTSGDPGKLGLTVSVAHTQSLVTSVSGFAYDAVHNDNTVNGSATAAQSPEWSGKFDARYSRGPIGFNWTTRFISGPQRPNVEISNNPQINDYWEHSASVQYEFYPGMTARVGVNNITNRFPPSPVSYLTNALSYDVVGRSYFGGLNLKF